MLSLTWRKQYNLGIKPAAENSATAARATALRVIGAAIPLHFTIGQTTRPNRAYVIDLDKNVSIYWYLVRQDFLPGMDEVRGINVRCTVLTPGHDSQLTYLVLSSSFAREYLAARKRKNFNLQGSLDYICAELRALTDATVALNLAAKDYNFNGPRGVSGVAVNSAFCTIAHKLLNV